MDTENNTMIEKRVSILNPELRKFIVDGNIEKIIQEIGISKALGEENTVALGNEVLFVLLGLEPVEDFTDNLIDESKFDVKTALELEAEIEDKIFSKFSEAIKRAYSIPAEENGPGNNTESLFDKMIQMRGAKI